MAPGPPWPDGGSATCTAAWGPWRPQSPQCCVALRMPRASTGTQGHASSMAAGCRGSGASSSASLCSPWPQAPEERDGSASAPHQGTLHRRGLRLRLRPRRGLCQPSPGCPDVAAACAGRAGLPAAAPRHRDGAATRSPRDAQIRSPPAPSRAPRGGEGAEKQSHLYNVSPC